MLAGSGAPTISDYGVIGDCRAAALVSRYGSLDWLCWPRFDSPSIFAAILDQNKGGHWSIHPVGTFHADRAYIQDTNILQTRFESAKGSVTLTDLMPVCDEAMRRVALLPDHEIIRELRCTKGETDIEIDFYPRADYGAAQLRIRELGALGLRIDCGRGAYWLRSSMPLKAGPDRISAVISLREGDVVQFSLTYAEESPAVLPAFGEAAHARIQRSIGWWQQWSGACQYDGPYREAVIRSALALKLMTYAPSGAIAAAATTSLPERIGDTLNWDYRYCWLRDASLTIRAMLGCGYLAEAESFLTWLLHATRMTQPELRVLYTVFGQIAPGERDLLHLSGHRGSRPVRVGNGAREQFQLDVYGEVIEAAAQYAIHAHGFDRTTQSALIGFGRYVANNWDRPDEGIWEPRERRQNHTHSRLMCWVALDRLLSLADKGMLQKVPRELFIRERERIRGQIESRAWNEKLQSYVEVLDGDRLDATALRLAWYGFEHADSKRMLSTYEAVCEKLSPRDHLLYRYERQPSEGAFGVCCFWGVEHLAIGGGKLDEAHRAFQELLKHQNDLGLYAEEIDPQSGEALGNFPQAFTHVGLISAALTLAERERGEAHPAVQTGSDVKSVPAGAQV